MKVCDSCGSKDAKHQEVGKVIVKFEGYHANHHTHRGVPSYWDFELCPKCAFRLKEEVHIAINNRATSLKIEKDITDVLTSIPARFHTLLKNWTGDIKIVAEMLKVAIKNHEKDLDNEKSFLHDLREMLKN